MENNFLASSKIHNVHLRRILLKYNVKFHSKRNKNKFLLPRNKNKVLKKRYELLKTEIPLETDVLTHIIFRYEAVTRMRKDAFSLGIIAWYSLIQKCQEIMATMYKKDRKWLAQIH